jgi:hypothetical protein
LEKSNKKKEANWIGHILSKKCPLKTLFKERLKKDKEEKKRKKM